MSKVTVVDARNTYCPGPLMELISYIKEAEVGEILELLSTDSGTAQDVPEWANKIGHEIISNEKIDNIWHVKVRKSK